jgi:hypothetical protein
LLVFYKLRENCKGFLPLREKDPQRVCNIQDVPGGEVSILGGHYTSHIDIKILIRYADTRNYSVVRDLLRSYILTVNSLLVW